MVLIIVKTNHNKMKGIHSESLRHAMQLAVSILKKSRCKDFKFHNYHHTLEVVTHTIELSSKNDLNFYQMEPIIIAAWLHDVGYSEVYTGHENVSANIAGELLQELGLAPSNIRKILNLILVTKLPQQPQSIEEKIICDADLYHLGTPGFLNKNIQLRRELKSITGQVFTDYEWIQNSIKFLKSHSYFTEYGQSYLKDHKQLNIIELERRFNKIQNILSVD